MALDKFEIANLKRLQQCVAPNQNRIDRLKAKIMKEAKEASDTIKDLEEQNKGFQALIDELLEKENAPEEDATEEEVVESIQEEVPVEEEVEEGEVDPFEGFNLGGDDDYDEDEEGEEE